MTEVRRLHLLLDRHTALAVVSGFSQRCARPGTQANRHDLALLTEELLSNLVRHVFPFHPQAKARCRVQIRANGTARVFLRADGPPFNPMVDGTPGYGIALVRSMVSSYSWRYRGGTNRLLVGVQV